jgi:hypothetical protein
MAGGGGRRRKRIWATAALVLAVWCTPARAQPCFRTVVDEPGADICNSSYPDNFVPFSEAFQGFSAGCGGTGSVGIGYASHPYVTFKSNGSAPVSLGDQISVAYTGWATGSTGSIEIEASVSPDNTTWYPCGVAPGRNFLSNSAVDTISCSSPFAAADLYVRLETVTLSPALIFLRTMEVTVPTACQTCYTIRGKQILVKNSGDVSRRKIVVVARELATPDPLDLVVNTPVASGATLTVSVLGAGPATTQSFVLPAAGWQVLQTVTGVDYGFVYSERRADIL